MGSPSFMLDCAQIGSLRQETLRMPPQGGSRRPAFRRLKGGVLCSGLPSCMVDCVRIGVPRTGNPANGASRGASCILDPRPVWRIVAGWGSLRQKTLRMVPQGGRPVSWIPSCMPDCAWIGVPKTGKPAYGASRVASCILDPRPEYRIVPRYARLCPDRGP